VTGVFYINSTNLLPFRLKRISFDQDREIKKLIFKFIHDGKSISPILHADDKIIKFENLRSGISVPHHQFALLAKHIHKIA